MQKIRQGNYFQTSFLFKKKKNTKYEVKASDLQFNFYVF